MQISQNPSTEEILKEVPELTDVEVGEKLALMSVGAYGFVMGSTYNARPMPPEILVEGKQATVVRSRQTWEDLVRGEE